MSLQRRLLVYLLLCAPLVWAGALWVSVDRARDEVNELFDTEIIRLARQVQSTVAVIAKPGFSLPDVPSSGEADLRDLAVAVWDRDGRLLLVDHEGMQLPRRTEAVGFDAIAIGGDRWRVYYLQSPGGEWLVAAGQREGERDELVLDLTTSQILPSLVVLPLLLMAMAGAVRQALAPVRALAKELQARDADALQPVDAQRAPVELQPLLEAMNGLFGRIDSTLARERRFTADAAHELRTPLAVLRAQWDVLRRAASEPERQEAMRKLGSGIDRMDRLVTQMLALSRLEATERLPASGAIDWQALVEQAMSDTLALAGRRHIELACEWPPAGAAPFPLRGDAALMAVLVRNLLDNAVRYGPEGSTVLLSFDARGLTVENAGAALDPVALQRLGERFHRPDGHTEGGSGLGISIAHRIATLHGLVLRHGPRRDGTGVAARLELANDAAAISAS